MIKLCKGTGKQILKKKVRWRKHEYEKSRSGIGCRSIIHLRICICGGHGKFRNTEINKASCNWYTEVGKISIRAIRLSKIEQKLLSEHKTGAAEAQKAERDQKSAAREQLKAKWAALSTTQKNQVYAIEEKIVALEKEKLDTLVSLGVIDKTTADEQKQKLDERLSSQKSAGEYPSGKGAKGNRSHRQAQSAS